MDPSGLPLPAFGGQRLPDGRQVLRRGVSRSLEAIGLTIGAVAWNGIIIAFIVAAVGGKGEPDWCPMIFLSLFLLVGVGIAIAAIRRWMGAAVPEFEVTLPSEPLTLGQVATVELRQPRPMRPVAVEVTLKCSEKVQYRQGTDTRTETHDLINKVVLERAEAESAGIGGWRREFQIEIPATAIHSFKAANNEIVWQLIVKTIIENWPDNEDAYPLRVVPEQALAVVRSAREGA